MCTYTLEHLIVRSRKVSNGQDCLFRWSYLSEMWQESPGHSYREACGISGQSNNLNFYISRIRHFAKFRGNTSYHFVKRLGGRRCKIATYCMFRNIHMQTMRMCDATGLCCSLLHIYIYIMHTCFLELLFPRNWSVNSIWRYTYYLIVITEGSTIKEYGWWQTICRYSSVYGSSNYPMILECNNSWKYDAAAAIVSSPRIILTNRYQCESMYIFVLI